MIKDILWIIGIILFNTALLRTLFYWSPSSEDWLRRRINYHNGNVSSMERDIQLQNAQENKIRCEKVNIFLPIVSIIIIILILVF